MATKNIVPRAAHEGQIGTVAKPFLKIVADEVDIGAVSVQTQLDDKEPLHQYSRMMIAESDCFCGSFIPLINVAIATGTVAAGTVFTKNHPGVIAFKTSTSANSGHLIASTWPSIFLGGGESFNVVFYVPVTTDTTVRMGYHNGGTVTAPVSGVYLQIIGTTLTGVARSNDSETDTADTPTIVQGIWYRAKIVLNADATLATFTLFTCADGLPVAWVNNTVATNIPTVIISPEILATNVNADVTAKGFFSLDWYSFWIDRVLVR